MTIDFKYMILILGEINKYCIIRPLDLGVREALGGFIISWVYNQMGFYFGF